MSLRPNARVELRRNRYKVAVDADEGRRRREDNMVEIRKNRREENLQKKRREGIQQFPVPVEATTGIEKKVCIRIYTCAWVFEMVKLFWSGFVWLFYDCFILGF